MAGNKYYYNGQYYNEADYVALGRSLGWTKDQTYGSMQGQDWAAQQLAAGQTPEQITTSLGTTYSSMSPQQKADYNAYLAQGMSPSAAARCGGTGAGGMPSMPSVGTPKVTPAPPYEKTPEQIAWEEMYSGKLEDWIEAGGYGIPEETQQQMIQRITEGLKAKENEDIRIMRNNMERRGLSNSGFVIANEQKIRAATTTAIANSMTDIQIQSALMKVASYERAIGAMGDFLGYLSAQSQLEYAPKIATWQAQQQANLTAYTAQVQAQLVQYQVQAELYKTQMMIAAEQQNQQAYLDAQWKMQQSELDFNRWKVEREIEYSTAAASATSWGNILGTVSGLGLALAL